MAAGAATTLGGCGSDGGGTATGDVENVGQYLEDLPAWSAFAPPAPSGRERTGDPVVTEEVVSDVPEYADDADGSVNILPELTYDCEEVPYSLSQNPERLVVMDPNRDILYPGALLQGKTHRDGQSVGDLLPLTIAERVPVRVSIPDVANKDSDNYREVMPNQAEVAQAVGDIVGNATADELATPSSISFTMESYHSEKQFAAEASVSGRYLGFKASASGSTERNASETTVAVQFTQRMFTVVVEPPGSGPESFFSEDFTADKLAAQVDAGRIGPDNLPVYVSSVVYGRMMTFTLTSSASESAIRAALQASYNSIGGGASAKVEGQSASILAEAKIALSTLGGNDSDALAVIRSGDWSAYFNNSAALSAAVPLSYTFKNLGDNSIASVSESSEFTVKTCTPRVRAPGVFEPLSAQDFTVDAEAVNQVIAADIDGDGLDDLVFNHRGTVNRVQTLLGAADGHFTPGPSAEITATPALTGWPSYALQAGDVDGDGDDDLVWNYNMVAGAVSGNTTYTVRSEGGTGTVLDPYFADPVRFDASAPSTADGQFPLLLGDVTGDGRADLLWSSVGLQADNRNWFAVASDAPEGFTLLPGDQTRPNQGWGSYRAQLGDFNRDGVSDVLYTIPATTARAYVSLGNPENATVAAADMATDSVLVEQPYTDLTGAPAGLQPLVGDVDGDGADDLLLVDDPGAKVMAANGSDDDTGDTSTHTVTTYLMRGTPGPLAAPTSGAAHTEDGGAEPEGHTYRIHLADVAGDDGADLLLNDTRGTVNEVRVGLSTGDGGFDFVPAPQRVRGDDEAWSQYELLVGQFGGNAKRDLLWVRRSGETRVFVMLAR